MFDLYYIITVLTHKAGLLTKPVRGVGFFCPDCPDNSNPLFSKTLILNENQVKPVGQTWWSTNVRLEVVDDND